MVCKFEKESDQWKILNQVFYLGIFLFCCLCFWLLGLVQQSSAFRDPSHLARLGYYMRCQGYNLCISYSVVCMVIMPDVLPVWPQNFLLNLKYWLFTSLRSVLRFSLRKQDCIYLLRILKSIPIYLFKCRLLLPPKFQKRQGNRNSILEFLLCARTELSRNKPLIYIKYELSPFCPYHCIFEPLCIVPEPGSCLYF